MLHESWPYKEQLRRDLAAIGGEPLRDDEEAWVRMERFVFWSAFVIRKLSEAKKLSDELEAEQIQVSRFPRSDLDGPHDFMNAHKIERFYDLDSGISQTAAPLWLSNQLIHSFVFIPETDDDGRLTGLYFNSDLSREDSLFYIAWSEFKRMIMAVAGDDVVSMGFDRRTGELSKSRIGSNEPWDVD
jgi:hypothetical protein